MAIVFLALFSIAGCGQKPALRLGYPTEVSAQYRIFYVQEMSDDGGSFHIYSIVSDGSDKRDEKRWVTPAQWDGESEDGVYESMSKYVGDTKSPDGKREIVVRSGFIPFFSKPRLFVRENGQDRFLLEGDFSELEWLPNSRGIVLARRKLIGIIDLDRNMYAVLSDGFGYFKIESNEE